MRREEYENIISEYLNNGYKMVSQSNYNTQLKKISVLKYIFWLLIMPNIVGLFGRSAGHYSGYTGNRFTYATLTNMAKYQSSFIFAGIALLIGIIILFVTRENGNVFIRVTDTGDISIIGYTLEKRKKVKKRTTYIAISIISIIGIYIAIGMIGFLVAFSRMS